jgi:NarL family two-component system sensor histidine kinase YdfH
MARRKTFVTYLIAWLFAIGTALRYLSRNRSHPEQVPSDILWSLAVLFALFFVLLLVEPRFTRRSLRYTSVLLLSQSVIAVVISLMTPGVDFFATLLLVPILQAMLVFPSKIGFRWLVAITSIMVICMLYGHPFEQGFPLVIIMSVAYLFVGAYVAVTRDAEVAREEAEAARKESQRLLTELQTVHEQLQAYAIQVEDLAITSERNRLARDLHDSVTQLPPDGA